MERSWANPLLLLDDPSSLQGLWIVGRVVEKLPACTTGYVALYPTVDLEIPIPLGPTRLAFGILQVPEDSGTTGELKRVTLPEVDEDQTRPRIGFEVAQGVEHAVPDIVGNPELRLIQDAYEAGIPPRCEASAPRTGSALATKKVSAERMSVC